MEVANYIYSNLCSNVCERVQAVNSSCTATYTRDMLHSPDHLTNAPSLLGGLFKLQKFPSLPLACQCHCCPAHASLPAPSAPPPPQHPPAGSDRANIFKHHSPISHVNISAGSDEARAGTPNSNCVLLCNKNFRCESSD